MPAVPRQGQRWPRNGHLCVAWGRARATDGPPKNGMHWEGRKGGGGARVPCSKKKTHPFDPAPRPTLRLSPGNLLHASSSLAAPSPPLSRKGSWLDVRVHASSAAAGGSPGEVPAPAGARSEGTRLNSSH